MRMLLNFAFVPVVATLMDVRMLSGTESRAAPLCGVTKVIGSARLKIVMMSKKW